MECRFDDDGDDGGHANRAALVFQSPKDLVNCFEALENDGRLDIVAVSNGFLASVADDENPKPTSAPHEVALAVDLLRQGILCDVRLRLRALDQFGLRGHAPREGCRGSYPPRACSTSF